MKRFSKMVEGRLMEYIPSYKTYKTMAEEKLKSTEKVIPYDPVLLKTENDLFQPVFIIEKDEAGTT
jgi:hypothetical protein